MVSKSRFRLWRRAFARSQAKGQRIGRGSGANGPWHARRDGHCNAMRDGFLRVAADAVPVLGSNCLWWPRIRDLPLDDGTELTHRDERRERARHGGWHSCDYRNW